MIFVFNYSNSCQLVECTMAFMQMALFRIPVKRVIEKDSVEIQAWKNISSVSDSMTISKKLEWLYKVKLKNIRLQRVTRIQFHLKLETHEKK